MIQVTFFRTPDGAYKGFDIKGHAGYAPAGQDIVCAAISAISYTALGGILNLVDPDTRYTVEEGWLGLMLPADLTEDRSRTADIILKTMHIGVLQIEKQYGKLVSVREKVEEV